MKSFAEYRGIVATDFDGTIHSREGGISAADIDALKELGAAGVARVIATGRSPYSFYSAIDSSFPADFLIFSSGAGILEIKSGLVLRHLSFSRAQVVRLAELLEQRDADFMLHFPVPINHHFYYRASVNPQPDFQRRLALYRRFATPMPAKRVGLLDGVVLRRGATQIVVIFPPDSAAAREVAEAATGQAGVIWATSPLDGKSRWLELFPLGTDKGSALSWLAGQLGITARRCLGVGNDYNDLHLLEWCGTSRVVANAPEQLRRSYQSVPACKESGFSRAVESWLGGRL